MKYLMTGIELQLDKGFGVTADAYYQSAQHLSQNHFEHYESTQQAEMPQNFLFRHAIELYLKSLIIIFHKKLKLDYGSVPFNSEEPEAFVDGKWRKLYNMHYIDKLYYYWLNSLLLPNVAKLNELAPNGDWVEVKEMTSFFPVIAKYDQDSSYFRYPITKNAFLDSDKYTMKRFNASNLNGFITEIQQETPVFERGSITMLMIDDGDNITDAFRRSSDVLPELRNALQKVAFYFYCIHIMARVTLCDGM
jgi:hypothetical protein